MPDSTPPESQSDAFWALRLPYVTPFATGRALAAVATQIVTVAVGWDLYVRTDDALALGLVGLAQVAPAVALMIPAGNVSDLFPRRNVAMVSHTVLAIAAVGLGLISWFHAPIALVYALIVLTGIGRAFAQPSTTTLLAQLLTPVEYQGAYAWLVSTQKIAQTVGPALGGLLIAWRGDVGSSYALAALLFLGFVAMLAIMPSVPPAPSGRRPSAGDIFEGIKFIRRTPVFLGAITLDLFGVLLGGAVALLPVYAKDILETGPSGLGLLRAAPSAGAVLMALLATRMPPFRRPGRTMLLAFAGFGLATIGFGISRNVALSLFCLALTGAFDAIGVMVRGTLEQALTPDRLRGRVSAVNYLFIGLSNELGGFESGATASLFGTVPSVVGGGIGTLIVVLVVPLLFPALIKVGPVSTLKPDDPDEPPAPEVRPSAQPLPRSPAAPRRRPGRVAEP